MKGNRFFVNEFDMSNEVINFVQKGDNGTSISETVGDVIVLNDVLNTSELVALISDLETNEWIPVGINGMSAGYTDGEEIGSYRLSCYEEKLAKVLFDRVREFLPDRLVLDEYALTEWDDHATWELTGLNPLFRFIKYLEGGKLVTHYDRSFVKSETERSLLSFVLYLDADIVSGGSTRFVQDEQDNLPLCDRDLSDWDRVAEDDEVSYRVAGVHGSVAVFKHLDLHDSEPFVGNSKLIVRTDVMYRKIEG